MASEPSLGWTQWPWGKGTVTMGQESKCRGPGSLYWPGGEGGRSEQAPHQASADAPLLSCPSQGPTTPSWSLLSVPSPGVLWLYCPRCQVTFGAREKYLSGHFESKDTSRAVSSQTDSLFSSGPLSWQMSSCCYPPADELHSITYFSDKALLPRN